MVKFKIKKLLNMVQIKEIKDNTAGHLLCKLILKIKLKLERRQVRSGSLWDCMRGGGRRTTGARASSSLAPTQRSWRSLQ